MVEKDVVLELDCVSKIYTSGLIVRTFTTGAKDVSFKIKRGEIVSLVGESGSGKSTIANIILRLVSPSSGHIYIDGEEILSFKKRDYYRKVQVIFQDPYGSFNYFYKIDRALDKSFSLRKDKFTSSEKKEVIIDTLKQIGLNADEVLGRYPHQLSGGQLQRFLLARVLLINPELLIADEATSMIDASSRAGILNLLENLREKQGLSVLFITHDIGQAQYISDRVLIMKEGEIVERGSCEEIFSSPNHSYTKELLASVPSLYERWKLD
ncbi:MAG: ABC transporter ATP-binding protein [Candidatus Hermodarchaeota archaeon]